MYLRISSLEDAQRALRFGKLSFQFESPLVWMGSAFLLPLLTQGSPSSEGLIPELHTHTCRLRLQTFLKATVGRSVVLVATAFLEVQIKGWGFVVLGVKQPLFSGVCVILWLWVLLRETNYLPVMSTPCSPPRNGACGLQTALNLGPPQR